MPDPVSAPADAAIRPDVCPLCGGPNGCGLAAGASTCWCFETTIPAAVIDRVPDAAVDRSCICAACAGQIDGGAPSPAES